MNAQWIAVGATALTFAAFSPASAQTIIVEDAYAAPVYRVAPAPVYAAPVIVAPPPRVYVAPAPVYAAPVVPVPPVTREVVTVPAPAWGVAPGTVYAGW